MVDLFNDGDSRLPIRLKINGLAKAFQIADTDVEITAGATTSIPVTTTTMDLLDSGDTVILVDATTGTMHELTLSADLQSGATAIAVNSYTFTSNIPVGSIIFPSMKVICNKTYIGA
jgi:hypothetical protein